MSKFYITWSLDRSHIPADQAQRGQFFMQLLEKISHDLESGAMKDWGVIPGQAEGFCVAECETKELMPLLLKFVPFIKFDTHPMLSAHEAISEMRKLKP